LDRVIQSVTGKSFAANLEVLIIDSLGLNNTAAEPQVLAVPLAKSYTFSRKRGFIQGR
jgi:CubicO group peptidase (beta-lactamase class C family)